MVIGAQASEISQKLDVTNSQLGLLIDHVVNSEFMLLNAYNKHRSNNKHIGNVKMDEERQNYRESLSRSQFLIQEKYQITIHSIRFEY
jgi:hypothetical protein